tara:strand:- start:232 stop:468 length:237 start_codon:yes stop_codon:yes gene_type:complete
MKPITVKDYEQVAPEFFEKYWYVAKELGEGAKPEDVLKIMESLGALVVKKRVEDKIGPFGFLKKNDDDGNTEEENKAE